MRRQSREQRWPYSPSENFASEGCDRRRQLDPRPPGGGWRVRLQRHTAEISNCFLGNAYVLSRKARNRPDAHSLLARNGADALACGTGSANRSDLGCVIRDGCGPTKPRPVGLCPRQASHDTFADDGVTSSARASSVIGIVKPTAFAVAKLKLGCDVGLFGQIALARRLRHP